jgi:hypothetical protein
MISLFFKYWCRRHLNAFDSSYQALEYIASSVSQTADGWLAHLYRDEPGILMITVYFGG